MKNDAELLRAWREGDLQAANTLFERYFPQLRRFFSTKVDQGIEDLIQGTFLACVRSRDTIRDPNRFRSYLFSTARYQLFARRRTVQRARQEEASTPVSGLAGTGPSPSELLRKTEDGRVLLQAMRRLALDHQICLELFYWEHFSTQEIAEVIGIPRGSVKRRLWRARQLLREHVEALVQSPEVALSTVESLGRWAEALRANFREVPST